MNDKTIAALREWKKQYDIFPSMAADKEFLEILSHAVPVKEVEPLAMLADRKGVSFEVCPPSFYVHNVGVWDIGIGEPKKGLYTSFEASTYAECESKARAYLESLEDVKEGR